MKSGAIPDEVIQAVLKKTDIVEWIGRTVSLAKRGRNYLGLCPFHSEKSPSFNVQPEKGMFHCFGCGVGGNVIRFVMTSEGMTFPEAVRLLAEQSGIPFDFANVPSVMTEEQREAEQFFEVHEEAAKFYGFVLNGTEQGRSAYHYLKGRGFTQKLIDEFQIGYAPPLWDSATQYLRSKNYSESVLEKSGLSVWRSEGEGLLDRFRDRIMFPIRDANGRVIAFGGRSTGDTQPKYLNSPETALFHKNKVLYSLHLAKSAIRKSRVAVLFEGYVDVIKAWEAGIENGVATLGTALTESHIGVLRRYCDKVLICYDGDRAGAAAAHKSVLLCEKMDMPAEVALLPGGMDPDEFIQSNGAEAFRTSVIQAAVPSTKYKILYLKKEHTLQDESTKLSYVRSALSIIAALTSPTEREHYTKELSAEVGYSFETLKQEMNEIRQKVRSQRDKNEIPWNTDMNEKRSPAAVPAMRPAYYNAERLVLSAMMFDGNVAALVQEKIGDGFHVEAHAALAAFIYAYYAEGKYPDPSAFMGGLHDDKLEAIASSIMLAYPEESFNDQAVTDCLLTIRKRNMTQMLKQKRQELAQAQHAGNYELSMQIGAEIIALERE